jgi:hypothetical protein
MNETVPILESILSCSCTVRTIRIPISGWTRFHATERTGSDLNAVTELQYSPSFANRASIIRTNFASAGADMVV